MKFAFGVLFLAAGHVINVRSLVIYSPNDSLDWDSTQKSRDRVVQGRFQVRSPHERSADAESIDIRTIIGTAKAATLTFNAPATTLPTRLVTDTAAVTTGTDIVTAGTSTRSTLIVTKTEIEIVTATTAGDSTVSVGSSNSGTKGFGGEPGQVVATIAPSAGDVLS